jgi:hypothetical protein
MIEAELLDQLVTRDERPGDWDDVLRRARRTRASPRALAAAVVIVAAVAVTPAVAVLLTRDRGPQLPSGADRSRVAVVLDPATGRLVAKVAPWQGHRGICFAVLVGRSACVDRGTGLASLTTGYTFDRRVTAGTATMPGKGRRVPLVLSRFPKLGVTFFYARGKALRLLFRVELRGADGRVLHTLRRARR